MRPVLTGRDRAGERCASGLYGLRGDLHPLELLGALGERHLAGLLHGRLALLRGGAQLLQLR